jgi:hypothetical protein
MYQQENKKMAHRWKLRNCESCNARTCLSDICINSHMIKHRKLVKSQTEIADLGYHHSANIKYIQIPLYCEGFDLLVES